MRTKIVIGLALILTLSLLAVGPTFSASIFSVVGTVRNADETLAANGLEVVVSSEARGLTSSDTLGSQEAGKYGVVFVDTGNKTVAVEGDALEITVKDGEQTLANVTYQLTADDIAKGRAIVDVSLASLTPATHTSIFAVVGTIRNTDNTLAAAGLEVIVTNETRGLTVTTESGKQEQGKYSAVFINMENEAVAGQGDVIKVTVKDTSVTYQITADDIAKGRAVVDVKIGAMIPVNQPPVAAFFFSPENPSVNMEITFDASPSYDVDGQITLYEWNFGDGSTATGQRATHAYISEGQYAVVLNVTDDNGATTVASWQIGITDASELEEMINARLFQMPVYPPYLLDTDSFNSAVNTMWQNFTDWFRWNDLTDNYEELYYTGIEYDSLRYTALIGARDFLNRGDIANARRYLGKADTYAELSYLSFQGASYVFEANLEVAETIAQSIKDGCQTAVVFGLTFVNPTAAKVADFIYDVIDFGIEYHLGDQEKAVRDFIVERAIKTIFNEVHFGELGGKTVAEWTKNRAGKYMFPILSRLAESEEWQHALSGVIKEGVAQITKDVLIEITSFITDKATGAINSLKAALGSPAELRVYDSQNRVTGLINGEVKSEIPGSVYDDETIIILFPADNYQYEVVGTEEGTYGLEVVTVDNGQINAFTATDIPTTTSARHQYSTDWNSLSRGEEGVTVEIDENGDGIFENTAVTDNEFTQDEYLTITQSDIKGDINDDGNVRSNDAVLALRIAAGIMEPTEYQKRAADMNDDGKIRSNDAMLILRKAAGLAAPGKDSHTNPGRQITVVLAEFHGGAGESIAVPINIDDNIYGLAAGDICVAYDPAVLHVVDISSELGALLVSNISEPGMVRIAFAATDRLSDRTIAELQFNILADDVSPLTLQRADLYQSDASPIESRKIDGKFTSWAMAPKHSTLLQNFPNPFNPDTWIPYQLVEDINVTIRIYSIAGQLVRTLNLGHKPAGIYISKNRAAYWNGMNEAGEPVSSGVYLYTLRAGDYTATKKMIITK